MYVVRGLESSFLLKDHTSALELIRGALKCDIWPKLKHDGVTLGLRHMLLK